LRLFESAQLFERAGDSVRAEQYYAAALESGRAARHVLPALLRVLVRSGRLRTALSYLEPALRAHPDDTELRFVAANLYLSLGRPREATRELARIERQDPQHAASQYLGAIIAYETYADEEEARVRYAAYLELEPLGDHAAEARAFLRETAIGRGVSDQ
jgi:thioredoxin-like negative regulator of GroEL